MSDVQQKIYQHLEELQKFTSEIPADLQQRIPNELLSVLATSLVEGPIFEIVSSLTEVQNVTEKQLFRERLQVLRGHSRKYFKIVRMQASLWLSKLGMDINIGWA